MGRRLTSKPALLYFNQEAMERSAAAMGGGDLVVPVQRVADFLAGRALPPGHALPESRSAAEEAALSPPALTTIAITTLKNQQQQQQQQQQNECRHH